MSDQPRGRQEPTIPPEYADPDQLLEAVESLTGICLWVYDIAADELRWSDRAKQLHGFSPDDRPTLAAVADQYAEADRERMLSLFDRALEEGEPFDVVVSFVGDRTTERAIRVCCEPQAQGDAVRRLYGTVQDVTGLRRREQRIQVLRETSHRFKDAHSRREVAQILADAAANVLGLVNTAVRVVDEQNRILETVVATEECVERAGERPDYPVSGNSPAARVFRTGEPERFADVESIDDWDRGELVSGVYVPIGEHGVLSAGDVVYDAFDESDLEAAALLGDVGAETLTRIEWARRSRAV